MNMPAGTLFNEQNKGPSLLSIITRSVLGKQNVQAENVYFLQISRVDFRSISPVFPHINPTFSLLENLGYLWKTSTLDDDDDEQMIVMILSRFCACVSELDTGT